VLPDAEVDVVDVAAGAAVDEDDESEDDAAW
jgi:hypothetical protein